MIILRAIAIMLLTTAVAGCGSLSAPPTDKFYRLQPEPQAAAAGDSAGPVIFVPPFDASGLHSERALVYAAADGTTLEQYGYHFWIDSPRMLLQQALADQLRGSVARQVVLEPSAEAAYVIRGRIRQFERQASGGVAQVSLAFEVRGRDASVPEFERVYTRSVELDGDSVAAYAAAAGAAARDVIGEFIRDLRTHWGS